MSSHTDSFRIVAETLQCAGSARCKAVAPELFDVDDDGWVRVLDEEPAMAHLADALKAYESCPLGVIDIVDLEGNSLA